MDNRPSSVVSEEDIVTFQNDGAICLRGVFDQKLTSRQ